MKRNPSVSIIMNCFNSEKYLAEAIESVFSQSFTVKGLLFRVCDLKKFFSLKDLNRILSFISKDKKNDSNKINLILLKKRGLLCSAVLGTAHQDLLLTDYLRTPLLYC